MSAEPAIELQHVGKRFGQFQAVDDVTLRIGRGEVVAIIGPNGAGKSTLLGMIAGETSPSDGVVLVSGQPVRRRIGGGARTTGIGRTFQVSRIFGSQSIRGNVAIAAERAAKRTLRCWRQCGTHHTVASKTQEILEYVGLADRVAAPAASLPQGDRKRLELAMCLVQEPTLLVLDEPTNGMTVSEAREVVQLMRRLHSESPKLTVLLSSHDMDVVFSLAETVYLMAEGRIVLTAAPEDLRQSAEAQAIYLGSSGYP